MHFEILVEDQSGKISLEEIVPRILQNGETFKIHHYKGIGHIPKNLNATLDPQKRVLLNHLPRLLSGYGKTFNGYGPDYKACVIIVCDLDNRNFETFLGELNAVLEAANPRPTAKFCLCVEEGEAWLLGHREAVEIAYPTAKASVLDRYEFDSICGTWELMADALYPGGCAALQKQGKSNVGYMKCIWAETISPLIDLDENKSLSFQYFVNALKKLSG